MVNKFTKIKERVLYLSDLKGFKREDFFEKIKMSYGSFKGKAKNTPLNSDAIANILTIIPDTNALWLLTGEGEMLTTQAQYIQGDSVDVLEEPKELQSFKLVTDNAIEVQAVPLYSLEATAGLVELFRNHNDIQPIDTIHIPNLPKCDGSVFITGDSMYPLLKSGDIVMYKEVSDIQNNIYWGQMYLISIDVDDDEYVVVKYVQKSEKGDDYINLVSQNKNHQDKDVLVSKIKALALIKASIRINTMS